MTHPKVQAAVFSLLGTLSAYAQVEQTKPAVMEARLLQQAPRPVVEDSVAVLRQVKVPREAPAAPAMEPRPAAPATLPSQTPQNPRRL
ncbi:MAG: hypothetical protein KatS3mg026_1245 [Bacteroidia bacterium]|nr:MAG: hypothetical protein KatS3mg026_1245 [Bacteroidia bacterium]